MNTGYVYVLENPSMPKLVKIGLTTRTVEARMRDLNSTGVPEKFIEVYSEYVSDCRAVERAVHDRLSDYRVNKGREFFMIEADDAAAIVRGISLEWRTTPQDSELLSYDTDEWEQPRLMRRGLRWLFAGLYSMTYKAFLFVLILLFIPIKFIGEMILELANNLYEAAVWVAKIAAIFAVIYLLGRFFAG